MESKEKGKYWKSIIMDPIVASLRSGGFNDDFKDQLEPDEDRDDFIALEIKLAKRIENI